MRPVTAFTPIHQNMPPGQPNKNCAYLILRSRLNQKLYYYTRDNEYVHLLMIVMSLNASTFVFNTSVITFGI